MLFSVAQCLSSRTFIISMSKVEDRAGAKSDLSACIGFLWQGFGSRGATGVASVRSCQKLPLCPIKSMPAGSKLDTLLAKAEPMSDSGSASVMAYLRKGKEVTGE